MADAVELDLLARRCLSSLKATCVDEQAMHVRTALLELLLEGQPVRAEDVGLHLGWDASEALAAIQRLGDLELDASGRIVGCGISLRPTPHRMTIDGRSAYTWCALDTLTFPPLLERTAEVESTCPRSKTTISLVVTPHEVRSVVPEEAVVSLVIPNGACCGIRESFCAHVHFFRAADDASGWLDDHPDGILLGVDQAYELGKRVERLAAVQGAPE